MNNKRNCFYCNVLRRYHDSLYHFSRLNFLLNDDANIISEIDALFMKFRTITFVLQKSISNNEIVKNIYDKLNNKIIIKDKISLFMKEERNKI